MTTEATIVLHPGREKPVRQRHPWVFSGAIARLDGAASPGDAVRVVAPDGTFLARGIYNPRSQIVVRLLTWDEGEAIDDAFWGRQVARALDGRARLPDVQDTDAYRLIHAESDGIPGLVVDRYGDWLAVQFSAVAAEAGRAPLLSALAEMVAPRGIIERADAQARRREALPVQEGVVWGDAPPETVEIREHGHRFRVNLRTGQKTGFYLDQRENRRLVAQHSRGGDALNAFSYTGAFAVYLLAAGMQHVVNVDESREALELAEANLQANGFDPETQAELWQGDVFQALRDWRSEGRRFDLVVLDPPKFATSAEQVTAATRGYKDINLLALHLLRPGGLLATFSCSGLVTPDLFQKVVFGAAVDAGRDVHILRHLSQGADHPILLSFPEGEYLKGLLCRVW